MHFVSFNNIQDILNGIAPKIGGSNFMEWAANTAYSENQLIVYEGQIYKVTTNFTSGSEFSEDNLEAYIPQRISSQDIQDIIDAYSSSGGGGLNVVVDTLWEGGSASQTQGEVLTLKNPYTDYDYIIVYLTVNNKSVCMSSIMNPSKDSEMYIASYQDNWCSNYLVFSGATCTLGFVAHGSGNDLYVGRIEGIKFLNPNNYSTNEQRIGTWVDGKPLYQITIIAENKNVSSSTGEVVIGNIGTNIEDVISIDTATTANGTQSSLIPYIWTGATNAMQINNTFSAWVYITRTNGDVRLGTSSATTYNKIISTIKYTKSS